MRNPLSGVCVELEKCPRESINQIYELIELEIISSALST